MTHAWVVSKKYTDRKQIGNVLQMIQTDPSSIKDKNQFEMAGGSHTLMSVQAAHKEDPENPNFLAMMCQVFSKFNYYNDDDDMLKFQLVSEHDTSLTVYVTSSTHIILNVVFLRRR